ncbi:archaellin/type IV pilin N-terminal domain-containing protein [Halorubrum sp. SY-15]|uniref:archaellin/type IV pilin N-terminal domain-containing protein n=1 Tax=Halorubrum sp. SY-15 TaxID=3402277 RepID=UPI003EB817D9
MFEAITTPEERGQVGIGTLIVFIAMVLVAAIAAGVLINTAGFLQTQAEATGEDSTALVSERINVNSEVGIVASGADTLDELRIAVTGAPGADQIDLAETTLQVVGPGGQENLVFTDARILGVGPYENGTINETREFDVEIGDINQLDGMESDDRRLRVIVEDGNTPIANGTFDDDNITDDGIQNINITDINPNSTGDTITASSNITIKLYNSSSPEDETTEVANITVTVDGEDSAAALFESSQLGANEFAVRPTDGDTFVDEPVLSEETDYTLVVNPDEGAFDDGTAFGQGDDATIDIVSPAGATTRIELNAPDLFSEVGEAVLL